MMGPGPRIRGLVRSPLEPSPCRVRQLEPGIAHGFLTRAERAGATFGASLPVLPEPLFEYDPFFPSCKLTATGNLRVLRLGRFGVQIGRLYVTIGSMMAAFYKS